VEKRSAQKVVEECGMKLKSTNPGSGVLTGIEEYLSQWRSTERRGIKCIMKLS